MKKTKLMLTGMLVSTMAITGLAGTAYACKMSKHERGDKVMYMMENLNLSQEQKKAITEIRDQHRQTMRSKRDEMKSIRMSLWEQARAKEFNEVRIRELAESKAKLSSEMTVSRMKMRHQIQQQLSEAQIDKMQDMMASMKHKKGKRHHYQR
jgi:Spy/CpxP family protein refolding chaperone